MLRVLCAPICLALAVEPSLAADAPVSFERFSAWFKEEWNHAQLYPPIAGFMVQYSREYHERTPSGIEVQQLQRRVAGRPDHPDREKLAEFQRLVTEGPKKETYRIWSEGQGRWRRSADYNHRRESHPFFDVVMVRDSDDAWCLAKFELVLLSPARGFPEGRDYSVLEGSFTADLRRFYFGGFGSITTADLDQASFQVVGDKVRVFAGNPDSGTSADFVVRWDGVQDRGFVQSMRYRTAGGDFPGRELRFDGWQIDDVLQIWRAGAVVECRDDGSPKYTFRFERSEPVSAEQFDAVVRAPTPLAPDAVRGAAEYEYIHDYRTGAHRVTEVVAVTGSTSESPRDSDHLIDTLVQRSTGSSGWRWFAGSSVGTLLLLAGAWLFWKRRFSNS